MIDCHNHSLPGLDDGAHDLEYALAMIQLAVANGITAIFATPHHLNGVYNNPRRQILKAVMEFRTTLAENNINLPIYPGSELHLTPELPSALLEGEALTYADRGKAALVELPKQTIPTGTENVLEELLYHGITPIIAHPERNAALANHPEQATEWVSWGCKLQLTAQSCAGDFGRPIQDVCRTWCDQGVVHLIASDAHRARSRPPDLRKGVATVTKWLDQETADLLTRVNPQRLITGEDLLHPQPVRKSSQKKKKWHSRFTGS